MPDLTALPPWAVFIFLAAAGIGFVVIRSGILDGMKKAPGQGEIVALSIDSRSLDKLTGEVSGLAISVTQAAEVGKKMVAMIEKYIEDQKIERADQDVEKEISRRVAEEREHEKGSREMEAEVGRRVTAELERQQQSPPDKRRPSA